ncbi:hypothetical protein [Pararhodonellum marinum]|uniref:hypothetical protein n=1 Tax=Pararhodonellum marinum TaxID=2755358 RepID=UPI00188F12C8|nr:hypothetical protein [Pararhodonellum marinum]
MILTAKSLRTFGDSLLPYRHPAGLPEVGAERRVFGLSETAYYLTVTLSLPKGLRNFGAKILIAVELACQRQGCQSCQVIGIPDAQGSGVPSPEVLPPPPPFGGVI